MVLTVKLVRKYFELEKKNFYCHNLEDSCSFHLLYGCLQVTLMDYIYHNADFMCSLKAYHIDLFQLR